MTMHPNTELVAVGWLKGIAALGNLVATDLPSDNSTWSASGFVQVQGVGGTPSLYLPIARPVVSVDCWAVNPNSGKPPWNKANQLAEIIRVHLTDHVNIPRLVDLPATYNDAYVGTAIMLSEPRRIRDDNADFAHYSFDLELHWIEVAA